MRSENKDPKDPSVRRMKKLRNFISNNLLNLQNFTNKLDVWYGVNSNSDHYQQLLHLRYQVYVMELNKNLPQADHERRLLPDHGDSNSWHFLIGAKWGKPLGCVRLHLGDEVPQDGLAEMGLADLSSCEIGRFGYVSKLIVDRSIRGQGAAIKMMFAMIEHANQVTKGHGDYALFHCNPRLVTSYERLGFRRFGRPFIDCHVGLQIPMVNMLGDFRHFRAINSPLTPIAKRFASSPSRLQELHEEFLVKRLFTDNLSLKASQK